MEVGDPLGEAEETAVDAQPVAGGDVVSLGLVRVADLLRLGRGEVAALFGGQVEEPSAEVTPVDRYGTILYRHLMCISEIGMKLKIWLRF